MKRHEGTEGEQRYTATVSLTSTLHGNGWLAPHPDRFNPGKEKWYLSYRRLRGSQNQSGQVRKSRPHRLRRPVR